MLCIPLCVCVCVCARTVCIRLCAHLCYITAGSLLQTLLTAGGSLTSGGRCGNTPLHYAATNKDSEVLEFVLRSLGSAAASAVNSVNSAGLTPLQAMLAIAKDGEGEMGPEDPNIGVLKGLAAKLINAGANIHVRDAEGNSLLHVAGRALWCLWWLLQCLRACCFCRKFSVR
jgi:hypothetical protein